MWNSLSVDELLIKLNQNTLADAASDDDYPKFYRDLAHKIGCSVEVISTLSYIIYIITPLPNHVLFLSQFSFIRKEYSK